MITTVDGVIKKAGDTAWAISLNHDRIYESIQVVISDADSLAKCLYFDDRGLCSEQVGLMNKDQCNLLGKKDDCMEDSQYRIDRGEDGWG